MIIFMMRESRRLGKEEQVKVVIRLKPEPGEKVDRCVYLNPQDDNQLVVETGLKREIFLFDHVAHQGTSQLDTYRMLGQECVQLAMQGYNCCIFAYGQTGSGKTYSVLGNLADLHGDIYCPSRGIIPRLLEEIFETVDPQTRQTVTCSYMEIYNEQIFDLVHGKKIQLAADKRIHQIREDAKRGVFIEGLSERKIGCYRQAAAVLLEGEKTRRLASTHMNTESSRSHAIFTIIIESETMEENVIRSKKAKLHVVDLAGSERIKHTHVEGDRLKQGCSINRSLHVLGNVINSLVESARKKKHIPFRDSKLTHYLKDSLGGNSITKLLANVQTSRKYFGDTISTLMFAKRAKILKMKVELNESTSDNYDSLRREVRRLREEIVETRYFKADGRISERTSLQPDLQTTFQRFTSTYETEVQPPKEETLKLLQQNQLHYKALIEIYEQHMKICPMTHLFRKQKISIVKQWKKLQKKNFALTNLIQQTPSFAKIYRQNAMLRMQKKKRDEQIFIRDEGTISRMSKCHTQIAGTQYIEDIEMFYEALISEMQSKFKQAIDALQKSYIDLQNQCKLKDKKIKDLKKRREYPPDIQQLKQQNQYLQLNILTLENEIGKINNENHNLQVMFKQMKKEARKQDSRIDISMEEEDQTFAIYQKLIEIKKEAQRQSILHEKEKNDLLNMIQRLQVQINKLTIDHSKLRVKYSKSKSRGKSARKQQSNPQVNVRSIVASNTVRIEELKAVHQKYAKEELVLKMDIRRKAKEIHDLQQELEQYVNGDRRIQEQFGKNLEQIICEYRKTRVRTLQQSRSVKNFYRYNTNSNYQGDMTAPVPSVNSRNSSNIMDRDKTSQPSRRNEAQLLSRANPRVSK